MDMSFLFWLEFLFSARLCCCLYFQFYDICLCAQSVYVVYLEINPKGCLIWIERRSAPFSLFPEIS